MNAKEHLDRVIDFVSTKFCEVCKEDCDQCQYYDKGNCPILVAESYLYEEEGYEDE